MPDFTDREFAALMDSALASAREPFRNAVADAIVGRQTGDFWGRYEKILARTLAIAQLIGIAEEVRRAKKLGAEFEFDQQELQVQDIPNSPPVQFQEGAEPFLDLTTNFKTKTFTAALNRFVGRVPTLATTMRPILQQAAGLARSLREAEQGSVRQLLEEQSEAVRGAVQRRFWVSDVDQATTHNLQELVADGIRVSPRSALQDVRGLSLPEFIDESRLKGAVNLTDARLETVFRNNTSRAFNDARAQALQQPAAQKVLPLMEIVEIGDRDGRGRETHATMNGFIHTVEFLRSNGLIPPAGHNCRGSTRGVTASEARRKGLLNDNGTVNAQALLEYNGPQRMGLIQSGQYPDPGWVN